MLDERQEIVESMFVFFSLNSSPLRRRGAIAFLLISLIFSACTDYESMIVDDYEEWLAEQAKSSSVVKTVSSSSRSPKSSSSSSNRNSYSYSYSYSVYDLRDGKSYKVVKIGKQTWMAENLKFVTQKSYCYNNKTENCNKYGRLYTWAAAMDSVGAWGTGGEKCGYALKCSPDYPVRGICPSGWHLPTKAEFDTLFSSVGGQSNAFQKLKSTTGWIGPNGDGTDIYAFTALPAGYRDEMAVYNNALYSAYFWSSTEESAYDAIYIFLGNDAGDLMIDNQRKDYAFSVRCVEDYMVDTNSSSSSSSNKEKSSSSADSGRSKSSSSRASQSLSSYIQPVQSSSSIHLSSDGDGGTCAPVKASVELGESVVWKYSVGGLVKTTDMLSANLKWTTPDGSREILEGKGAKFMSDTVVYETSGLHMATLLLATTKGTFNIQCTPVQVNESKINGAETSSSSSSSKVVESSSSNKVESSSSPKSSSSSKTTESSSSNKVESSSSVMSSSSRDAKATEERSSSSLF